MAFRLHIHCTQQQNALWAGHNSVKPSNLSLVGLGAGPRTVFTLRFHTAYARGSGLREPDAGVQVCLIAGDGHAVLHRVGPLHDPVAAEEDVRAICQAVDSKAGANCDAMIRAAQVARMAGGAARPRFQVGSIDEVSFLGPELGPLASVLIGPERGSRRLDELSVASSRSRLSHRFVCRQLLGGSQGAALLSAVPENAVVYGSGNSAKVLSLVQARMLQSASMAEFAVLKSRLLVANACLVALGAGLAYACAGAEAALPFSLGGGCGLLYALMLQRAIDALPVDNAFSRQGGRVGLGERLEAVVGSLPFRYVAVALLSFASLQLVHAQQSALGGGGELPSVGAALLGFLMYKVSFLGVFLFPPPTPEARQLAEDSP